MSDPATLIATRGWDDLADAVTFYPEDLPADWRPTYYANAFDAVLLPWAAWSAADPAVLAGWAADVRGAFRFFLARPPDDTQPGAAAAAALALDRQFGGWVTAPTSETFVPGVDAPAVRAFDCTGPAGRTTSRRTDSAILLPDALHRDLRAGRDWWRGHLARYGAPPRLVVLARPTAADLTAWQTLVALL